MLKISIILIMCIIFTSINTNASDNENYTHLHVVDINSPISLQDIKERYVAYDNTDGLITNKIIFETEYDISSIQIGTYDLYVSVTNSLGYTTSFLDQILVRDFSKPTINFIEETITIDLSTDDIKSKILSNTIIYDEYDNDFKIIILEQEKLMYEGQYNISYYVEDASSNISNILSITVNIIETIKKNIIPLTININSNNLSKEDIINLFRTKNPIEQEYKNIEIESNYFNNPKNNNIYETSIIVYFKDDHIEKYFFKIHYEETNNNSTNFKYYMFLGVISSLLLISIIIYKKRSNLNCI